MSNMNNLVSIVVPVYNISEYVGRCLDSLLKQTYRNIEIIVVNDGSTDDSFLICEKYSSDSRVRLFSKTNGGLSSARNYGIEVSNGDYICFVDGDDYISNNYVERLLQLILDSEADIAVCNFYYEFDGYCNLRDHKNISKDIVLSNIDAIKNIYSFDSFGVATWNKMFKKDSFDSIRFPLGKISEDYYIMFELFYNSKKIAYTTEPLYFYVQREGSITKKKRLPHDVIEAAFLFRDFVINNKLEDDLLDYANLNIVFSCVGIYDTGLFNKTMGNKEKKELVSLVKNKEYSFDHKLLPRQRKIQLFIFRHLRFLYDIVFVAFKKRRTKRQGR